MDPYIDRYLHEYEQEERREQAAAIVDWWRMQARHKYYLEPQECDDSGDEDFWALADEEDESMYDELERY